MPRTGFEPARLSALPPQSSASANSATWAWWGNYTRARRSVEMIVRGGRAGRIAAMQVPMAGVWHVTVQAARAFTIHGDLYYEMKVVRDDDPQKVITVQLPQF